MDSKLYILYVFIFLNLTFSSWAAEHGSAQSSISATEVRPFEAPPQSTTKNIEAISRLQQKIRKVPIEKLRQSTSKAEDMPVFDPTIEIHPENDDDIVPYLIKQGHIPGITDQEVSEGKLYVKDVTRESTGSTKRGVFLIGLYDSPVSENMGGNPDLNKSDTSLSSPKIMYVLKKLYDENEIKFIRKAYQYWGGANRENAVWQANVTGKDNKTNTYFLKLAWHERIFYNPKNKAYYELLHAAKGIPMRQFQYPSRNKPFIFSRANNYVITESLKDLITPEKIEESYYKISSELLDIKYSNGNQTLYDLFRKQQDNNFRSLARVLFKEKQTSTDEAKAISKAISKALAFMEQFRFSLSYIDSMKFNYSEHSIRLADSFDWGAAKKAYEATGAFIGLLFKKYNYNLDSWNLDMHHDNLFFNPKTNTLNWIDLQWLGEDLNHRNGGREPYHFNSNRPTTIGWALNHFYWLSVFEKDSSYDSPDPSVIPYRIDGNFHNSIKSFLPDPSNMLEEEKVQKMNSKNTKKRIESVKKLRNELYKNIQSLYEAFALAFIQNYNPAREVELKEFFKDSFNFPFNDNPRWQQETEEYPYRFCDLE